MIGTRVGSVVGIRVGSAIGSGEDEIAQAQTGPPVTMTTLTNTIVDSADPVNVGSNYTYTIQIANTGAATATGVAVSIVLDSRVTWVSTTGTGWTLARSGQTVTATMASLAVGSANPIVVTVTAANSSAVTASTTSEVTADNANTVDASQNTSLTYNTTLTSTLVDSADPVNVGANYTYTAQVTNTGAVNASSVSCVITLDSNVTWVSSAGTGWALSRSGQVVTATLASLAPGAANPIVVTVTAANASALTASTNSVTTASNATEVDTAQTTSLTYNTTLTVGLTDSADPVLSSLAYSYACVVTNTGGVDAANVTALITLDSTLTYVSSSGTGWTTGQSGGVVTCTRATLAVGAAPTITVNVTSSAAARTNTSTGDADADNTAPASQSSQTTVVKLVDTDATSAKRVPSTAQQWTDLLAYYAITASVPTSFWAFQMASGDSSDSIGSRTLTKAGTANHTYQQAVTGWTRTSSNLADNSTNRWSEAAAVGPNPSTTSLLTLGYVDLITTPAGTRNVITNGGVASGSEMAMEITSTPHVRGKCLVSTVDSSDNPVTGGVRPCWVMYDRANSVAAVGDEVNNLKPTYSALVTDGIKGFGASNTNAAGAAILAGWRWEGAAAESITLTELKAILSALGWTPTWTP